MLGRLTLVLSWWAFLHAVVWTTAAILALVDVYWLINLNYRFGYLEMFEPYVSHNQFGFGFAPAVWLVTWILTGSARILPWKRLAAND